jgi:hypothetical protein
MHLAGNPSFKVIGLNKQFHITNTPVGYLVGWLSGSIRDL